MSPIRDPQMRVLSKEFQQPEGFPDTPTVNQRTMAAVARLQVRGSTPQANPLATAWKLHALIKVLGRLGVLEQKDLDDITYFTALFQMQDLERIVDEKPSRPLIVPSVARPNGN